MKIEPMHQKQHCRYVVRTCRANFKQQYKLSSPVSQLLISNNIHIRFRARLNNSSDESTSNNLRKNLVPLKNICGTQIRQYTCKLLVRSTSFSSAVISETQITIIYILSIWSICVNVKQGKTSARFHLTFQCNQAILTFSMKATIQSGSVISEMMYNASNIVQIQIAVLPLKCKFTYYSNVQQLKHCKTCDSYITGIFHKTDECEKHVLEIHLSGQTTMSSIRQLLHLFIFLQIVKGSALMSLLSLEIQKLCALYF
ncbi:Hypothetical_protein [Hexamita inflata]|nr:Hypothetical protein HINF_LOCUS51225 [Hexamita inflata]